MRAFVLSVALLVLAYPATAWECQESSPEVTTPATTISVSALTVGGENPGIYYVENDACQPECLFSVWIYEETNGIPGLQRGDQLSKGKCDSVESDTIIF